MSLCTKLDTEPGSAALPGSCVRKGEGFFAEFSIFLSINQV